MRVVLSYECGECGGRFDHMKHDRAEPDPECPICAALAARQVPAGFSIGGSNVSKAADLTYDIVSKDYGMNDMRDNLREGDIATITPPHLQKQVESMWRPPGEIIAAAKSGAAAAKAEGSNPLTLVQGRAKSNGAARVLCNPVNRTR